MFLHGSAHLANFEVILLISKSSKFRKHGYFCISPRIGAFCKFTKFANLSNFNFFLCFSTNWHIWQHLGLFCELGKFANLVRFFVFLNFSYFSTNWHIWRCLRPLCEFSKFAKCIYLVAYSWFAFGACQSHYSVNEYYTTRRRTHQVKYKESRLVTSHDEYCHLAALRIAHINYQESNVLVISCGYPLKIPYGIQIGYP